MRFNSTAILYPVTTYQDSRGNNVREYGEPREVYANVYEIGLNSYIAAQAAGLHADAEIQMRSIDYEGEQAVAFDGKEYTVERVSETGEYVRLTLARKLGNQKGGGSE